MVEIADPWGNELDGHVECFLQSWVTSSGATGTDEYIAGIQSALAGGFATALVGLKDL